MGEHKLPRTTAPPLERPTMSIIRLSAAVQEFDRRTEPVDVATMDYMRDLTLTMRWLAHVETENRAHAPNA